MAEKLLKHAKDLFKDIRLKNVLIILLGSAILSFGIYNIHDISDMTEGGILGMDLLIEHLLGISPAFSNIILTAACFAVGWKVLGRNFIIYSAVAAISFSVFYRLLEFTQRLMPGIADHPLAAAIIGALFVGVGTGLSMREGGAQCGDDALAMAINHYTGWKVFWIYFVTDLAVMLLSLTYIPLNRIAYSCLTAVLSSLVIDRIVNFKKTE